MEQIVLTLKDNSHTFMLLQLLRHFDFVENVNVLQLKKQDKEYDFFQSAGMWKDRNIDANQLRKNAWKRN